MPKDQREPQSYGSNTDWVTGKTGQKVNEPKDTPEPEHRDFYDERRESETSQGVDGGQVSGVQLADSVERQGRAEDAESRAPKVTTAEGGSRRGGFFKKRDYE